MSMTGSPLGSPRDSFNRTFLESESDHENFLYDPKAGKPGSHSRREEESTGPSRGPSRFTSFRNSVKTWSEDHPKLAKLALTVLVLGIIAAIVVPVMNHYGFAHCGQEIAKFWNHSVVPFFTANKEGFLYVTLPLTGLIASIFALYHGGPIAKDAIMEKYLKRRLASLDAELESLRGGQYEQGLLEDSEQSQVLKPVNPRIEQLTQEKDQVIADKKAIAIRQCKREIESLSKEKDHYQAVLQARKDEDRGSPGDSVFGAKLEACKERLEALEDGIHRGKYPKPPKASQTKPWWNPFAGKKTSRYEQID